MGPSSSFPLLLRPLHPSPEDKEISLYNFLPTSLSFSLSLSFPLHSDIIFFCLALVSFSFSHFLLFSFLFCWISWKLEIFLQLDLWIITDNCVSNWRLINNWWCARVAMSHSFPPAPPDGNNRPPPPPPPPPPPTIRVHRRSISPLNASHLRSNSIQDVIGHRCYNITSLTYYQL